MSTLCAPRTQRIYLLGLGTLSTGSFYLVCERLLSLSSIEFHKLSDKINSRVWTLKFREVANKSWKPTDFQGPGATRCKVAMAGGTVKTRQRSSSRHPHVLFRDLVQTRRSVFWTATDSCGAQNKKNTLKSGTGWGSVLPWEWGSRSPETFQLRCWPYDTSDKATQIS